MAQEAIRCITSFDLHQVFPGLVKPRCNTVTCFHGDDGHCRHRGSDDTAEWRRTREDAGKKEFWFLLKQNGKNLKRPRGEPGGAPGAANRDARLRERWDGSLEDSEPEPEPAANLGKRRHSRSCTDKQAGNDWDRKKQPARPTGSTGPVQRSQNSNPGRKHRNQHLPGSRGDSSPRSQHAAHI